MFRRSDRARRDVDEELEAHIEARVEYLIERGTSPEAARDDAIRRFGNFEAARAALHAQAVGPRRRLDFADRLDEISQDVRYVARGLTRSPAFSAGVVATLALGLGINSAVFRVADHILFRPPAGVTDARAVRWLEASAVFGSGAPQLITQFSYPDARIVTDAHAFATTSAYGATRLVRSNNGRDVPMAVVDAAFFPLLGVTTAAGRTFDSREGAPGAGIAVAVVSHDYWRRELNGRDLDDRATVVLADRTYHVIGVTPAGFTGVDVDPTEVWLPLGIWEFGRGSVNGVVIPWYQTDMMRALRVMGRPAPGTSDDVLASRLTAALSAADEDASRPKRTAAVHSLVPVGGTAGNQAPSRLLERLTIVAAVVLLIACANAVNLLLARGMRRHQEIAIRMAIGASRARVARLLIVESVSLALIGGAAAMICSYWTADGLRRLLFPDARWTTSAFDQRTLLFTAVLALMAGVAAGLAPALQSTTPDLVSGLKGSRSRGSARTRVTRATLVIAQTALSLALLVASALLVRSLLRLNAVELGFEPAGLVMASVPSATDLLVAAPRDAVTAPELADRIRASAKVDGVALASVAPFGASAMMDITAPGSSFVPETDHDQPFYSVVSANYFSIMRMRMLRGRGFSADDVSGGEPVAVVNATMARRYWADSIPPGACILSRGPCARVVGVVDDVRDAPGGDSPPMRFYLLLGQIDRPAWTVIARTSAIDAPALATAIKSYLPATQRATIEVIADRVARALRPWHTATWLFVALGGVALVLACIGVYSVMSYIASERVREFGIRIVLGATAQDVMRLVLFDGLRLTMAGGAIGVLVAAATGRLLGSLLFDVSPFDPAMYGLGLLCLGAAGICAVLPPAMRASRINPVDAFRSE